MGRGCASGEGRLWGSQILVLLVHLVLGHRVWTSLNNRHQLPSKIVDNKEGKLARLPEASAGAPPGALEI